VNKQLKRETSCLPVLHKPKGRGQTKFLELCATSLVSWSVFRIMEFSSFLLLYVLYRCYKLMSLKNFPCWATRTGSPYVTIHQSEPFFIGQFFQKYFLGGRNNKYATEKDEQTLNGSQLMLQTKIMNAQRVIP
jgi:hypothetical protein